MDILSAIYSLTQEYEILAVQNLSDDKQEILRLKIELQNCMQM